MSTAPSALRRSRVAIAALLALATFWTYAPVRDHDFVNYDDKIMVVENPHLRVDATPANLAAHFWTPFHGNWLPVYWISLHLGFALHGPSAGAFLLTNVAIHAAAAVLLFLALLRMTGAQWPSAFVAGVFALHPLHVESVAWITERKDVLAGFFWMLGMWLYAGWVAAPSRPRAAGLFVCLAFGLMSKASLVTFPFALILLDIWPLERARGAWRRVVEEKVPLFALVLPAVALTYRVQIDQGLAVAGEKVPIGARLLNAVESYGRYLRDAVWPEGLAALYPHPYLRSAPTGDEVAAGVALAALLGAVTVAAIALVRTRPYVLTGWLWYLGTLVPMIGIVQIGVQARADRYSYIPLVGLAMIVAFGAKDLAGAAPQRRRAAAVAGVIALLLLAFAARAQVAHWRDTLALFERAAQVTHANGLALESVAREYGIRERNEEAAAHFAEAVRVNPGRVRAHFGLAVMQVRLGRTEEAIQAYRNGLRLQPNKMRAHAELGLLLAKAGRPGEAVPHLEIALEALPDDEELRHALALSEQAAAPGEAPQRGSGRPGPRDGSPD